MMDLKKLINSNKYYSRLTSLCKSICAAWLIDFQEIEKITVLYTKQYPYRQITLYFIFKSSSEDKYLPFTFINKTYLYQFQKHKIFQSVKTTSITQIVHEPRIDEYEIDLNKFKGYLLLL